MNGAAPAIVFLPALLWTLSPLPVWGAESSTTVTFEQANQSAQAGHLEEALKLYQSVVDRDPSATGAWFNLANTAYRAADLPRAIAAYRVALSHAPRDPRIRGNLEIARRDVETRVASPTEPSALKALFFWHYSMSLAELGWLTVGLSVMFWGAVLLTRHRLRLGPLPVAAGGLVLAVLLGSYSIRVLNPRRIAVVNRSDAPVRTGTDHRADLRFKLDEGSEVSWLEHSGDWVRVALPSGQQGWIHTDDVIVLAL